MFLHMVSWLMQIGVAWCLYLWLSQLVVKLEKTAVKHWQVCRWPESTACLCLLFIFTFHR